MLHENNFYWPMRTPKPNTSTLSVDLKTDKNRSQKKSKTDLCKFPDQTRLTNSRISNQNNFE